MLKTSLSGSFVEHVVLVVVWVVLRLCGCCDSALAALVILSVIFLVVRVIGHFHSCCRDYEPPVILRGQASHLAHL